MCGYFWSQDWEYPRNWTKIYVRLDGYSCSWDWEYPPLACVWVLLILGLRVPTSSILVGTSDPRTGSTHVIEPSILCALVGTPAPRTESTHLVTGLFDWLWCVFMVFNVILLLFVNHSKDFFLWFTDCLTIGIIHETMVVHMTWVWNFFNNYSNHPRMCVLSTLCGNVDKHSPFDIYIYIYASSGFNDLNRCMLPYHYKAHVGLLERGK